MKWNRLVSAVTALCMLISGACAYAVGGDVLAEWKFEEINNGSVEDMSGNGIDAAVSGVPEIIKGISGSGMSFGGGSHILIPANKAPVNTDALTVSMWFKTDRYPYTSSIPNSYESLLFEKDQSYRLRFDMYGTMSFILNTSGDGWYGKACVSTPSGYALPKDKWNYIVCTFGGGKLALYINGELMQCVEGVSGTVLNGVPSCPLTIGASADTTTVRELDEVKMLSRAMTAEEVKAEYDLLAGTEEPPATDEPQPPALNISEKALFVLGGASGGTVKDLSENGRDAAVNGDVVSDGTVNGFPIIKFDGASYLSADGALPEGTEEFAVSAAVKLDKLPQNGYSVIGIDKENPSFRLAVGADGKIGFYINTENNAWNTCNTGIVTNYALIPGKWTFVTAVYDGAQLRIYADGTLAARSTLPVSGAVVNGGGGITIGENTIGDYFCGSLAHTAVYSAALTDEEVRAEAEKIRKYYIKTGFENAAPNFNEDSTNGFAAAMNGNTQITAGKNGQGIHFDGSAESSVSIDVGNAVNNVQTLAMGAWIKPEELITGQVYPIICKEGSDSPSFQFYINEEGMPKLVVCSNGQWYVLSGVSTKSVSVGGWSFVEAEFERGTIRMYVNGAFAGSIHMDGFPKIDASNAEIVIGKFAQLDRRFIGIMDDVYVAEYAVGTINAEVGGNVGEDSLINPKFDGGAKLYLPKDGSIVYKPVLKNGNTVCGAEDFIFDADAAEGILVENGIVTITSAAKPGKINIRARYKKDLSVSAHTELELVEYTAPYAENVAVALLSGNTYQVSYDYKDVNGIKESTVTYRWYVDGAEVKDSNSKTYSVERLDRTRDLKCAVTVTNELMTDGDYETKTVMSPSVSIPKRSSTVGGGGGGGGGGPAPSKDYPLVTDTPAAVSENTGEVDTETNKFYDMKNHWAFNAVSSLSRKNIINGTSEHYFEPDKPISRCETAAIIARIIPSAPQADIKFDDVGENSWYYESVRKAAGAGVMVGDGASFRPNALVTREEFAKLSVELLRYMGFQMNKSSSRLTFGDTAKISGWALEYVDRACANNIMSGRSAAEFAPGESMTRAEAAAVIFRITERSADGDE